MPDIVGSLRPPRLVSAPSSPAAGEMYYDTAQSKLFYWNGTIWVSPSAGANGAPGGAVYTTPIGDGAATSFTIMHNLSSRNVSVHVYRATAPFDEVEVDVERTDTQTVTIRTFPTVPAVGEYTVMVQAAGQQATLNITMDTWHVVGAAGEPAFQNSWAPTGSDQVQFRKDPTGRVWVRGVLASGASGTTAFTLPVGYRPPSIRPSMIFDNLVTNGVAGSYVTITTAGLVQPNWPAGAGTVYMDLSFDTESVLQTASVAAQPLDSIHVVGAAGEPAFQNSWVNFGTMPTYENASFRKNPDGSVRLSGVVKGGASGSVVFTLPVGYRPPANRGFSSLCSANAMASVAVNADGTITATNGTTGAAVTTYTWLEGIEFDTETVAAYASGMLGPSVVTALPTNPIDGQECYFQADAANGVMWHLRYRAGSPNANKWEFLGGSWMRAASGAAQTCTFSGTAFAASVIPSAPSLVVPLAGVYDFEIGAYVYNPSTAPREVRINIYNAANTISGNPILATTFPTTSAPTGLVGSGYMTNILAAGETVVMRGLSNTAGGTVSIQVMTLAIRPSNRVG